MPLTQLEEGGSKRSSVSKQLDPVPHSFLCPHSWLLLQELSPDSEVSPANRK